MASVIAVLSALEDEQQGLVAALEAPVCTEHAGRQFWQGRLCGRSVVVALSRIGKVAAAATTAALIERFAARAIVFTGVAGGVGPGVQVGDVVVGQGYLQHDMNAAPLFPRYQIPLTGQTVFAADADLCAQVHKACAQALAPRTYAGRAVTLHQGLIASGDRFVNGAQEVARLLGDMQAHGYLPLALDMESAAVAQTCADYGVAFTAVRTISDRADDTSHVDFQQFVQTTASAYAQAIVLQWLANARH